METRILKKINRNVRIVEDASGNFLVQSRQYLGLRKGMGPWHTLNMFSSHKKAIEKKNMHIVMVIMRDLGYRNEFVKRRTERKKKRAA